MKPPTETAAPPSAPELFKHDWADGKCLNPERFNVDGMPTGTALTLLLGCDSEGLWRMAWSVSPPADWELTSAGLANAYDSRDAAVVAACLEGARYFKKNRKAVKCLDGLRASLEGPESLPANAEPIVVPTPVPHEIAVAAIEDNPNNQRERPQDYIDDLADTIHRDGLLQRIGVKVLPPVEGEALPGVPPAPRYMLVFGASRLAAAKRIGLTPETKKAGATPWTLIRAEVYPATLSERAERRIIQVENLKRRNLNPIEEAQGYAALMRDFGLTQEEVGKELGDKSRPVIANALRLLDLPPAVQELLEAGALTAAHGTALCRFKAWPSVCSKLAELAVKKKTAAGALEKNLPFFEELCDAKLAVDLGQELRGYVDMKKWKKDPRVDESFFIWEDKEQYEDYLITLDVKKGQAILDEDQKQHEARLTRESSSRGDDDDGSGGRRSSGGGMSESEKKARAKLVAGNLKNRLENDALLHAALQRTCTVHEIDVHVVAIVARETLRHTFGGYGGSEIVEETAERLGLKLPKNFDYDDLASFETLAAHDALKLAAACVARREYQGAMNSAGELPDDVVALAAGNDDAGEKLVAGWKEQLRPLVLAGRTAEEITTELRCPEFLAEQLRKQIRREAREANAITKDIADVKKKIKTAKAVSAKTPLTEKIAELAKAKKTVAKLEKKAAKPKIAKAKKNGKRAVITDATRAQVKKLVEAGKTGGEIAKAVGISLPSVQNIKKALGLVQRR